MSKYDEEVKSTIVTKDYRITTDREGIEKHLKLQLYDLRRRFEYCSPILTMQKICKRFLVRKRYLKKQRLTRLLVWSLNRWYKRSIIADLLRGTNLSRDLLY